MSTPRKRWTSQQTEFLIKNYGIFSLESIARDLRIDVKRVKTKVYHIGIAKSSFTCYSAGDIKCLINCYKTKGNLELGKILSRSPDSVKNKISKLGLKRTSQQLRQIFLKNNSADTRFKKNHIPGNHKPVNTIVIRMGTGARYPTRWIKIAEPRKWDLLARVNYRKAHPDETITTEDYVSFRDGDPLNCEPDNLVIVTRREMMLRNNPKNKGASGPKMRSYIRLNGKKKKVKTTREEQATRREQEKLVKKAKRILAERKKRTTRDEKDNKQKAKLAPPDLSSLIPINIGRQTTIYIRPGQDPEIAKANFLNKYKESVL